MFQHELKKYQIFVSVWKDNGCNQCPDVYKGTEYSCWQSYPHSSPTADQFDRQMLAFVRSVPTGQRHHRVKWGQAEHYVKERVAILNSSCFIIDQNILVLIGGALCWMRGTATERLLLVVVFKSLGPSVDRMFKWSKLDFSILRRFNISETRVN